MGTVRDHYMYIIRTHTYLSPVLGTEVRVGAVVAQVVADLRESK